MKFWRILLAVCGTIILLHEAKHWILLAGLGKEGWWAVQAEYEQALDLYGVVLEAQSQQPIADAQVVFYPFDHHENISDSSEYHTNKTTQRTDTRGRFSYLWHRGASLYVETSKTGYYRLTDRSSALGQTAWKPSALGESTWSFTHHTPDARLGEQSFANHPSAPARFYLLKQGSPVANLIYRDSDRRVARDGTPYGFDLSSGNHIPVEKNNVIVECWRGEDGNPPNGRILYDWTLRISVPGGGLQERKGEFDFQAPESGYQPSEEFNMPAALGKDRWNSNFRRDYFLHLANGTYARMKFKMISGGEHFFHAIYYHNPAPGDRNLEAGADTEPREYR